MIGRDPQRIEDTLQYRYRGAYWRGGPVTMTAITVVDVDWCGRHRLRAHGRSSSKER